MSYKIINYYPEYGELEIIFEETNNTFKVILPIENDNFVTGDRLNQVLESFQNCSKVDERKNNVLGVKNVEEIKSLISTDNCKLSIYNQRQILLSNSDWTQGLDSPLSEEKKDEWKVYRQQLRDITLQSGFPLETVWPNQPI